MSNESRERNHETLAEILGAVVVFMAGVAVVGIIIYLSLFLFFRGLPF